MTEFVNGIYVVFEKNRWKKILVPAGRDYQHCVDAFRKRFGIDVPEFLSRRLSIESGGRTFIKVKSRDMPGLLDAGFGDVGMAYTDICHERLADLPAMGYSIIGSPRLQFCLLIPKERYGEIMRRLRDHSLPPVSITTAYPHFLRFCMKEAEKSGPGLNVRASPLYPTGSMEAMPSLGVSDIVADAVNTGASAAANSLVPLRLADISPALLYRSTSPTTGPMV